MTKLSLLLATFGLALAGCSGAADETAKTTPVQDAAALEEQAAVQDAVGDKAGAEALREKAAALRAGAATPEPTSDQGD